eukprot:scaffold104948_cov29-Tisochrysis_lutea.AAC.1
MGRHTCSLALRSIRPPHRASDTPMNRNRTSSTCLQVRSAHATARHFGRRIGNSWPCIRAWLHFLPRIGARKSRPQNQQTG